MTNTVLSLNPMAIMLQKNDCLKALIQNLEFMHHTRCLPKVAWQCFLRVVYLSFFYIVLIIKQVALTFACWFNWICIFGLCTTHIVHLEWFDGMLFIYIILEYTFQALQRVNCWVGYPLHCMRVFNKHMLLTCAPHSSIT